MNNNLYTIFYLLLGFATIYFPRFFFLKEKKLTKREIKRALPESQVANWYPWAQASWCFMLGGLYLLIGYFLFNSAGEKVFFLVGAWLAGCSIFDSLVAITSKIFPHPEKVGYFYVICPTSKMAFSVGVFQICFSILVIIWVIVHVFS